MVQTLITALLVTGCTLYAAWSLMPAAWRRRLASWLLRWAPRSRTLQQAARTGGGCGSGDDGCSGCSASGPATPAAPAGQGQVIRIHRRPGR